MITTLIRLTTLSRPFRSMHAPRLTRPVDDPNRMAAWVAILAAAFSLAACPAMAQSVDLSPIQNLLQGIVDAVTGPLGVVIGTLALIGVFLSWLFGILDFRQAMWVLVGIAGVAAAPTIVAAIWSADTE